MFEVNLIYGYRGAHQNAGLRDALISDETPSRGMAALRD